MTSEMYSRNDCMTRLIIAKLTILQIFAYIVNQSAQSYTHFEIYSKIWVCWVQSKIWCWRDQTDRLHDLSNFDDRTVWYNFIEIRLAVLCWFELWMSYILRHRCNLISHVRLIFYLSIFFAFIYFFSIFVSHSLHYTIVYSFTLWRWVVIRSSEFQKRISDTIQRVFEFSSRRKFHTRSIEIVRSCFRWRRNKWFSKSIHRVNLIISNSTICCVFSFFTIHFKKSVETFVRSSSFFFFFFSFFFHFFFVIIRLVNTITSFLFFRATIFFSFFSRIVHRFVTILSLQFFVVVLSTFSIKICLFWILSSIFNVVTTTKKWCLLSVIFHMLAMTSNYQCNYFEIFTRIRKRF